jgi:hypothetical protein
LEPRNGKMGLDLGSFSRFPVHFRFFLRPVEIMASIFVIASNNFMQEYKDNNKNEETHQEAANQPVEGPIGVADDDGPQRRKRGNRSSKKKLFQQRRVVLKKEKELGAVARHLGPDAYLERSKGIYEALTSKEEYHMCIDKSPELAKYYRMQITVYLRDNTREDQH